MSDNDIPYLSMIRYEPDDGPTFHELSIPPKGVEILPVDSNGKPLAGVACKTCGFPSQIALKGPGGWTQVCERGHDETFWITETITREEAERRFAAG